MTIPSMEGWAEPEFHDCLEAFRASLGEGELGAACAIYRDGKPVMDAWGGMANSAGDPWRRETAVPVFSVTKGIAALSVLAQVEARLLDLDRPVADFWPEFATNGKDRVTIREALGHQAGVPRLSGSVTIADLADTAAMSACLAAERPVFEPGSAHLYHAITIGWITTELNHRATGRRIGEWFQESIAGPLDLNTVIGLRTGDARHIAQVEVPADHDTPPVDPMDPLARPISLNGLIEPRLSGLARALNDRSFQEVELAGANALSDARSLAKLYSGVMAGGPSRLSAALIADATQPVSTGPQWGMDTPGPSWGAGLMIPWSIQPMLGEGSFGHDGAGGSLAFAHAPSKISFAYVRNRTGMPNVVDPLVYRVVNALADKLGLEPALINGEQ